MSRNTLVRSTLALLLSAMLVGNIASCSTETPSDTNVTESTSADTTVAETEQLSNDDHIARISAALPEVDYEGYTFKALDRNHSYWKTEDIFAEAQNGEPINDAIYDRNIIIEEAFNIKITEQSHSDVTEEAVKLILANEDTFDTLTDGLISLSKKLAVPGYLIDIKSIPEIDLTANHWDPMIEDGLSIADKLYFATGDISIMDNKGTWCICFNKNMVNDFSLDDPYDRVNNGTWTIDRLHEMATAVTLDLDGDGVLSDYDQWGYLTQEFNTYALWASTGETIVKKNSDNIPELSLYNERSVSVLENVLDLQLDPNCCITLHSHADGTDGIIALFSEGKALFHHGSLAFVNTIRASEVDFGILPSPKFDEAQDVYYNSYSNANFTAYSIPTTATDTSRTGNIMEAMAALSKYTLTPAYYDVSLEGKFLRDEESSGMIDLILSTRNFDLGSIFDWGGTFTLFTQMYNEKSYDLASKYAAIESNATGAIEDFIADLAD